MVLHGFACLLIRCGVLLVVNLRCALLFRCFPSSFVAASGSLPRGGILLAAWEFTPLLLQTLKCKNCIDQKIQDKLAEQAGNQQYK
jgi:hypothetical protein